MKNPINIIESHKSRFQLLFQFSKALTFSLLMLLFFGCVSQEVLINRSQNGENWEVRRNAFKKLNNNSLEIISHEAKDPSLKIAAKIRLGETNWKNEFSGNSLGNVIGAVALVDKQLPASYDIVSACHKYIRKGDASRIPELINLLNRFGDSTLAEDYMNCGQSTLSDAGCNWGIAHGYRCTTGYGSSRVRWGSEK